MFGLGLWGCLSPGSTYGAIIDTLKSAPVSLIPWRGKIEPDASGRYVTTQWRVSLNVCDWKIFQLLDAKSPNVRKVYRLLKTIRDRICPSEIHLKKINTSDDTQDTSYFPKRKPTCVVICFRKYCHSRGENV